jgi:putative nucleotidyltransferase with HDIG domain
MDNLTVHPTVGTSGNVEDNVTLLGVIEAEIHAGNVDLPPLPEIALKVRELIEAESDIEEIAAAIGRDPAYAAAILRYANSVAFAGLKQVGDLPTAMQRLGLKAVEQTVLALSARAVFRADDPTDERILRTLWEHSLTTAIAARRLTMKGIGPELAFLAGLLHDIGKVIVLRCAADLRAQSPERFRFSERVLLEFLQELHCRVGDAFLASWNIPDEVRDAVRRHHDTAFAPDQMLAAIVACADMVATKLGKSLFPDPDLHLLEGAAAELLHLDDVKVANLLVEVEDDLDRFNGDD